MTTKKDTIIIKRYASRRLYNTLTSDYITIEEVAQYIRDGKDIKIIDRKTGDDLTRQYLMQIITEYESRGENVLPINVLTDIVRSYNDTAQTFIPDFLSQSYEMLKKQQTQILTNLQNKVTGNIPALPTMQNMPQMEGLEQWQKMQSDFLGKMMNAWKPENTSQSEEQEQENKQTSKAKPAAKRTSAKSTPAKTSRQKSSKPTTKKTPAKSAVKTETNENEIDQIKKQLSDLQAKLHNL